jgi:predicted transcriptional regulator
VRYTIRLDDDTDDHFARLTARQRATVLAAIERQLMHQPGVETRHRKRMQADKPGLSHRGRSG